MPAESPVRPSAQIPGECNASSSPGMVEPLRPPQATFAASGSSMAPRALSQRRWATKASVTVRRSR